MARLPPGPSEAYTKNTKEQYEALGRFVAAFELMIHHVRDVCIGILGRGRDHQKLLEIAFHHPVLTAKPLFEIMRALVVDHLKADWITVSTKERETFSGVLTAIATEYFDLADTRNSLLHGTWYIGYGSSLDPDSAEFFVSKQKPTKTGLASEEGLPKTAGELLALRDKCDKVMFWIGSVENCVPIETDTPDELKITDCFQFSDGRWRHIGAEEFYATLR